MGTPILDSLEIRGFCGFRQLQIERLGRVNLIVGKNNVGKSSLLEALQLYACRGHPRIIWEILKTRGEIIFPSFDRPDLKEPDIADMLLALKYLFYGRKDVRTHLEPMQLGSMNTPEKILYVSVDRYTEQEDKFGIPRWNLVEPEAYDTFDNLVPRFTVDLGRYFQVSYPFKADAAALRMGTWKLLIEIPHAFVTGDGLSADEIVAMWPETVKLKEELFGAVRIIAPGVEGLAREDESGMERTPMLKIKGIDEPLSLRSLGEGMRRVLGIAAALVNARNGFLLIDGFENGLYYFAQVDLWRLIFQAAHRFNVQVFATTHSWDCIEGFQKAAQEDNQDEGLLIRLEYKRGDVVVTLFDERQLGIATRERIEVR